jgi:hypothetical protein
VLGFAILCCSYPRLCCSFVAAFPVGVTECEQCMLCWCWVSNVSVGRGWDFTCQWDNVSFIVVVVVVAIFDCFPCQLTFPWDIFSVVVTVYPWCPLGCLFRFDRMFGWGGAFLYSHQVSGRVSAINVTRWLSLLLWYLRCQLGQGKCGISWLASLCIVCIKFPPGGRHVFHENAHADALNKNNCGETSPSSF